MTNRYFQVTQEGIRDGVSKLNAGSSGVYRGMLAGWPSGGSLGTSTGSNPYGQFYDYLRLEEFPQSEDLGEYLDGREINVVTGKYICLCGPALFTAGTIPAVGTLLYPGTAGLLDTAQNWAGVSSIGRVANHVTIADVDGAGSYSVARCVMNLPVY
jgi:hypothetical protein